MDKDTKVTEVEKNKDGRFLQDQEETEFILCGKVTLDLYTHKYTQVVTPAPIHAYHLSQDAPSHASTHTCRHKDFPPTQIGGEK